MLKIAIIGSGIAAAGLAYALHDFADITVFEKARGIGGRLSTRYKDEFEFDLGAPFFSASHPSFQGLINRLIQQGVVALWPYQAFSKDKQLHLKKDYVALPRMNELPKFLLNNTKVCLEHKVTHLEVNGNAWSLHFEKQLPQIFDWVITTAPPAQSKALLPSLFEFSDLLREVELVPSLVLLLGLTHPLDMAWDCYEIDSDSIWRLIVNSNKPGRKNRQSLVIETSISFAKQHLDDDESTIISLIMKELRHLIPIDLSQISYQALHKWRYATSTLKMASDVVCLDTSLGLGVCGDWTEGGGVEGAYLSGVRMAHVLRQIILGTEK